MEGITNLSATLAQPITPMLIRTLIITQKKSRQSLLAVGYLDNY
jgi:hypothetical protein